MGASNLILAGAVALVLTLALFAAVRSRFVRGRLVFSAWLFLAFLGLELAVTQGYGDLEVVAALGRLVFVLAFVNLVIALLVNPWRDSRPSDRFPAIVQDVTVVGLFFVIATVLMREQLLATSAVGAVVVGFALQDTLGNFFAGMAIQIEKPFRVGHWISIGGSEGQVQEVTWRATKLRTKNGQFLIVPNSVISKDAILNYSEPTIPTRLEVEVGASYLTPPNEVKQAIHRAMANAPLVLSDPEAVVMVKGFGASSVDYAAKFWIEDYARDNQAKDQVRTNIWYEFRRSNIEIPYPIQIEYSREEQPLRVDSHVDAAATQLSAIDLFSTLTPEARRGLARAAGDHLFAAGEADRPSGRPRQLDVRGPARQRHGDARAIGPAGGHHHERRVLRRDVDADRRSAHRDRARRGRRAGAGDCRRGHAPARAVHARVAGAHQQGRFGSPRRPGASRSHRRSCRRGTDAGAADPTCADPGLPATLRI